MRSYRVVIVVLTSAVLLGAGVGHVDAVSRNRVRPVSLTGAHGTADGISVNPSPSADGRFVAFISNATDLVKRDGNLCFDEDAYGRAPCWDVYVWDRSTGQIVQASVSSTGALANANSSGSYYFTGSYFAQTTSSQNIALLDWETGPSMSGDGRWVAFASDASNLVAGDTNRTTDVFVHDLSSGRTERVSVSSSRRQANGASVAPSISADGRYVTFTSYARNLVGGDTKGVADVFVRDRVTGKTRRVSLSSAQRQADGASGNASMSPDGRYVAFSSVAKNLDRGDLGTCGSLDERWACANIFVRDLVAGTTRRVVSTGARPLSGLDGSRKPDISRGGRYVAFTSDFELSPDDGDFYDDVYLVDRKTGTTSRASRPLTPADPGTGVGERNGYGSIDPRISDDGRYVSFTSEFTLSLADLKGQRVCVENMGHSCADVYVFDSRTGRASVVSLDMSGRILEAFSPGGAISGDGRTIAFWSYGPASPTDTDGAPDVYVFHRDAGAVCSRQLQS